MIILLPSAPVSRSQGMMAGEPRDTVLYNIGSGVALVTQDPAKIRANGIIIKNIVNLLMFSLKKLNCN
jgi:hypothetical protein